jgi:hypothetical protein
MNLGEQLKAIQARSVAQVAREKTERAAAADLKARHQLESVQQFFRHAREAITAAIAMGEPPSPIPMGKRGTRYADLSSFIDTYSQNVGLLRPNHPYHFVWAEFAQWARENGLQAKLSFDHNGDGMDSWTLLSVAPA